MNRRRVCVVVASRANYGRVKYVMKAIQEHQELELLLIVGASTLLERFGKAVDIIKEDGFNPLRSIYYVVEGETPSTQAKSTGLGIVELSSAFEDLKPDIVITVADRFETMATSIASTYLNIPLVHIQGGEVSGNVDERVRHAITKLADYHFVTTEESKKRVINMGEKPETVFNYGCPAMDLLNNGNLSIDIKKLNAYGGVGLKIDWNKPYILLVQHPVTTSYGEGYTQIKVSLEALSEIKNIQKIVLWPNADAGSDDVSKGIRVFREKNKKNNFAYYKNFSPEDYATILKNSWCCVGNSSSFIREGSFLGVPAVIVGDRQENREHGVNVIYAKYEKKDILMKIERIVKKKIIPSNIYGNGNAGTKIAEELPKLKLVKKKNNAY